jgi:excisionase family DNA binding protein
MSRQRQSEPIYCSLADAATRLGVHPATLRRRIADGTLPAWRVGHKDIRLKVADVDRLLTPIETGDPR